MILYLKAISRDDLIAALTEAGMWEEVPVYDWTQGEYETVLERPETEEEKDGAKITMPEGTDTWRATDGVITFLRTIKTAESVQVGIVSQFKPLTMGDALDEIGVIYKPTGNKIVNADGETVDEMAPVEGYHANLMLLGEVPDLSIVIPRPANPVRVFAGNEYAR